jgi:hypothetical protein
MSSSTSGMKIVALATMCGAVTPFTQPGAPKGEVLALKLNRGRTLFGRLCSPSSKALKHVTDPAATPVDSSLGSTGSGSLRPPTLTRHAGAPEAVAANADAAPGRATMAVVVAGAATHGVDEKAQAKAIEKLLETFISETITAAKTKGKGVEKKSGKINEQWEGSLREAVVDRTIIKQVAADDDLKRVASSMDEANKKIAEIIVKTHPEFLKAFKELHGVDLGFNTEVELLASKPSTKAQAVQLIQKSNLTKAEQIEQLLSYELTKPEAEKLIDGLTIESIYSDPSLRPVFEGYCDRDQFGGKLEDSVDKVYGAMFDWRKKMQRTSPNSDTTDEALKIAERSCYASDTLDYDFLESYLPESLSTEQKDKYSSLTLSLIQQKYLTAIETLLTKSSRENVPIDFFDKQMQFFGGTSGKKDCPLVDLLNRFKLDFKKGEHLNNGVGAIGLSGSANIAEALRNAYNAGVDPNAYSAGW